MWPPMPKEPAGMLDWAKAVDTPQQSTAMAMIVRIRKVGRLLTEICAKILRRRRQRSTSQDRGSRWRPEYRSDPRATASARVVELRRYTDPVLHPFRG